ncbi:MAG: hypothetical protein IJV15_00080 [Lachnospiraceae bacterium]|nr:hypothetical protein [Lachnospiraceae bacterium]
MKELEQELQEIKNKINEIERRYSFVKDYKLICTLLDKCNLSDIKLSREEIEKNNSIYIVENNDDEIHVYRENISSYE